MLIRTAEFVISNTDIKKCPSPDKPEFAFIGRSNVGKSSLINLLVNNKKLAKISTRPGKTQTINHFSINQAWYLVDLPGYGYAGVSRNTRKGWGKMIERYLLQRENLYCTFVLVDARHEPQPIDIEFITWLGEKGIPLAIVLTKADKLPKAQWPKSLQRFEKKLREQWEDLPPLFTTSSTLKRGRDEILGFIDKSMSDKK
jgi:GTP-binding protein